MSTRVPMTEARTSPFATVDEAANYCRLSAQTIRRAMQDGRLASHRVGRRVLLPYTALDAFVAGPTNPEPNGENS